jgi:hypothetical protein
MAAHVQFIRQTPADAEEYIGLEGEIIIETETFLIRVHDGITPGGYATLTLASALAQFVTLTDFNAAITQIIADVTVINDDAITTIFGGVLIAKGPVLDILTGPPGAPVDGDRYLVASGGTSGIFIGKENQVVEWINGDPVFSGTPLEGHQVYVADVNTVYYYTTAWGTTNPDVTYTDRQTAIDDALDLKAPLASPALTGVPTAPTAAASTNTTQIATTAFVQQEIAGQGLGGTVGTEGSQTLGDIILKWGLYGGGSANPTINFAAAFPNTCYNVTCTAVGIGSDTPDEASTRNVKTINVQSVSASGFSAFCSYEDGVTDVFKSDNTATFYWQAIGR